MTTSEADRHDLYTRLVELLGETGASTLMTHLPTFDPATVATAADLAAVRADLALMGSRLDERFNLVDARLESRFDRLDSRVDRVFLTLAAGLLVIVGTMATAVVAGLP